MITDSVIGKKVFLKKALTAGKHPDYFNLPRNTVLVVLGIDKDDVWCDSIFGKFNFKKDDLSTKKT